MKFLLLFWTEPVADGAEHPEGFGTDADYQAWSDFEERLRADGSYVDSGDLKSPPADRMVRPALAADRDLPSPLTDGPVVSGYYVVRADDEAAARAIATSVPLYGTVEVRPVVDYSAWS